MISVEIGKKYSDFIERYAEFQTIGGYSNLDKSDLKKASRNDFQRTGVVGEVAFYLHRYGSIDKLKELLDLKFETLRPTKKGDGGFDDSITFNNKTRLVDIKTSHVEHQDKIKFLNLVIPQKEFHPNMIYVCAFSIGPSRKEVNSVILAGWEINECINKRWKYDDSKWCVPVSDLRPMEELEKYIRNNL